MRTPTDEERRNMERNVLEYRQQRDQTKAHASRLKVDPDILRDAAAAQLVAGADTHAEVARAIPVKLKDLLEKRRADIIAVEKNADLSSQGKQDRTKKIIEKAASDVAALRSDLEASVKGINTLLERAGTKEPQGVQAQLLDEMKANRISQRVQSQLSSAGSDPVKVVVNLQRLVDAVPDNELELLASEISFQTAGGQFGGDFMQSFINRAITPRHEASLSPLEAAALQVQRDASAGVSRIIAALNAASVPYGTPIMALPGWDNQEVYPVGGTQIRSGGGR